MLRFALLVTTALSFGIAQSASAADMARPYTKAPPMMAAMYNWTGFYIGAHVGGAWSNTSVSDPTGVNFTPLGASFNDNGSGFLGGGQIGYNWQTGSWVFGVQADLSGTSIDASSTNPFTPAPNSVNDKVDWLATLTGRVGYAWNNWLLYGKGGAAWVHNKFSVVSTLPFNASTSTTRTGWLGGVGLEYGITQNWTAFVEYDYIGLGTQTPNFTNTVGPLVAPAAIKQNVQMAKVGVNFKF